MRRIVRCAKRHDAAIGAHPGFRDPEGHGRRPMTVTREEVENLVAYQVGALSSIAALEGVRLQHVKPHGALYHQAAGDASIADAVAHTVWAINPGLCLVGLAGSELIRAARRKGLAVAEEAFTDRRYRADGTLLPRSEPGAVLTDERLVLDQLRSLMTRSLVQSDNGREIFIRADTLCLHVDTPGAERLIRRIRDELSRLGVTITVTRP